MACCRRVHQVDTIFITHLHGDHCFGIGTMLVSLCRAHKAAAAANATNSSSSSSDSFTGPDSPTALRVVGPPRLGELLSSMLFIAGVARQLDQPVYITEFVEDDRCGSHTNSSVPCLHMLPGRLTVVSVLSLNLYLECMQPACCHDVGGR